jgi:hypothetical protein
VRRYEAILKAIYDIASEDFPEVLPEMFAIEFHHEKNNFKRLGNKLKEQGISLSDSDLEVAIWDALEEYGFREDKDYIKCQIAIDILKFFKLKEIVEDWRKKEDSKEGLPK